MEQLKLKGSGPPLGDFSETFSGYALKVSAGYDIAVAPQIAVAPFVDVSLGQYRKTTFEVGGKSGSDDITDKAVHEFITVGVRGTYDL
jgi:hypothetical protein